MTDQAWRIQGWTTLAVGEAARLPAAGTQLPAAFAPGEWVRPSASGGHAVVVATTAAPTAVHVIPGSQALDLRPFAASAEMALPVSPGTVLLIDARLWMRAGPDVTLRLAEPAEEASTPASEELALWHSRGYAFLRGALPADRVAALQTAMDAAMDADLAAFGERQLRAAGQLGALRNLSDLGAAFLELLDDNPAYGIIDQVLRPGYVLQTFDGLVLHPGEGRYPWDFHTDLQQMDGVMLPRDRTVAVNVLYFVDATTVENGATWLVPHSHLCTLASPSAAQLAGQAVAATGGAGDVLVFDSRLWHCAGNNTAPLPRRLVKTLFSEPWIRPALDYRRALAPEKWAALSPFVRGLLGERASPPVSVAEFRGLQAAR